MSASEKNIRPIPLIIVDEVDGTFSVNRDALIFLRSIDLPLAIVSVSGMNRTGKSSLLNWILGRPTFSAGSAVNKHTKGIWLYCGMETAEMPGGGECAVVFLDTEGFGANHTRSSHDAHMFSLNLLLSSTLLFNSLGSLDENAITNLSFIGQLSNFFASTSTNADILDHHTNANNFSHNEDKLQMPELIWVIRDFILESSLEDDTEISSNQYLDNFLQLQKGDDKVTHDRNKIRKALLTYFPIRNFITLVRPLHQEETLQKVDQIPLTELRPEFRDSIIQLRNLIFSNLKIKTIAGCSITGSILATMIEQYIHTLNNGNLPSISNAWEYTCEKECRQALESAILSYKSYMLEICSTKKLPLDESDIRSCHDEATAIAYMVFKKNKLGGNADGYLDDLHESLSAILKSFLDRNYEASLHSATRKLDDLYYTLILPKLPQQCDSSSSIATSNPSSIYLQDLSKLKSDWNSLIDTYHRQVKGPAASLVLSQFLKDTFLDITTKLLSEIRSNYDHLIDNLHDNVQSVQSDLEYKTDEYDALLISLRTVELKRKTIESKNIELNAELEIAKVRVEALETAKLALEMTVKEEMLLKESYQLQLEQLYNDTKLKDTEHNTALKDTESSLLQLQVTLKESEAQKSQLQEDLTAVRVDLDTKNKETITSASTVQQQQLTIIQLEGIIESMKLQISEKDILLEQQESSFSTSLENMKKEYQASLENQISQLQLQQQQQLQSKEIDYSKISKEQALQSIEFQNKISLLQQQLNIERVAFAYILEKNYTNENKISYHCNCNCNCSSSNTTAESSPEEQNMDCQLDPIHRMGEVANIATTTITITTNSNDSEIDNEKRKMGQEEGTNPEVIVSVVEKPVEVEIEEELVTSTSSTNKGISVSNYPTNNNNNIIINEEQLLTGSILLSSTLPTSDSDISDLTIARDYQDDEVDEQDYYQEDHGEENKDDDDKSDIVFKALFNSFGEDSEVDLGDSDSNSCYDIHLLQLKCSQLQEALDEALVEIDRLQGLSSPCKSNNSDGIESMVAIIKQQSDRAEFAETTLTTYQLKQKAREEELLIDLEKSKEQLFVLSEEYSTFQLRMLDLTARLQDQRDAIAKENGELARNFAELNSVYDALKSKRFVTYNDEVEVETERLTELLQGLEKENKSIQASYSLCLSEKEQLQLSLSNAEETNLIQSQNIQILANKLNEQQQQLQEQQHNHQYDTTINNYEKELSDFRSQLTSAQIQIKHLTEMLKQSDIKNNSLQTLSQKTVMEKNLLQSTLTELKDKSTLEINEMKALLKKDKESYLGLIDERDNVITSLENQNEIFDNEIHRLALLNVALQSDITTLTQQYSDKEESLATLAKKISEIEIERSKLVKQVEVLTAKNTEYAMTIHNLRKSIESNHNSANDAEASYLHSIAQLEARLSEYVDYTNQQSDIMGKVVAIFGHVTSTSAYTKLQETDISSQLELLETRVVCENLVKDMMMEVVDRSEVESRQLIVSLLQRDSEILNSIPIPIISPPTTPPSSPPPPAITINTTTFIVEQNTTQPPSSPTTLPMLLSPPRSPTGNIGLPVLDRKAFNQRKKSVTFEDDALLAAVVTSHEDDDTDTMAANLHNAMLLRSNNLTNNTCYDNTEEFRQLFTEVQQKLKKWGQDKVILKKSLVSIKTENEASQRRIDELKIEKIELKKQLSVCQLAQAELERSLAEYENEGEEGIFSVAINSLFPAVNNRKPLHRKMSVKASNLHNNNNNNMNGKMLNVQLMERNISNSQFGSE